MQQYKHNHESVNEKKLGPDDKTLSPIVLLGGLVVVCIIVAATYWPVLSAQAKFFDDNKYLTENELVRNPSWSSAWRFLTEVLNPSTVRGYYQPLAMLSLMADYAMGGRDDDLTVFHATSLILHLANTVLIVVFLYQLFANPWAAALAGLLFGVHPLTVEPVSWLSERKTLLAAFFALWCLIIYVRFVRTNDKKTYLLCMVSFVLALMSKPTSTPVPLLMLLLNYWPLGRLGKKTIVWTIPFFVVSGVAAIITCVSQGSTAVITMPMEYSPGQLLLMICHNIVFYLYKFIWPARLSAYYPLPDTFTLEHPMFLAGIIGTCILIPVLIFSLRWTKSLLVGWLFFFLAVFPTLGVVGFHRVIAADRHIYLPMVGLLLPLLVLLSRFFPTSMNIFSRRHVLVLATVLIIVAAEIFATRGYLVYWRDSVGLYSYTLTESPEVGELHNNLGSTLALQKKLNQAIPHFVKAVQLEPSNEKAHYNLGLALAQTAEFERAITHFRKSLELNPNSPYTMINLAYVLATIEKLELRDGTEALRLAKRACELTDYKNPEMLNILEEVRKSAGLRQQ